MVKSQVPASVAAIVIAALAVCSCSKTPDNVEAIPRNSDSGPSVSDPEYRKLIAQRFNQHAKVINDGLQDDYERGQQACAGLKRHLGHNAKGCPRPKPNYVELMSEAPPR